RLLHLQWHAPQSRWRRLHDTTDVTLTVGEDVNERPTVQAQRHRPPQIGVVKGWFVTVDDQGTVETDRSHLAHGLRHLTLHVFEQRYREAIREGHVELPRNQRQDRRRQILNDRVLDAVEIRPVLLPIIWVARDLDIFVRFEPDEFERTGAD